MIKWILQDVKRIVKSKKSFLLSFIMIISVFTYILNNSYKAPIESDNDEEYIYESDEGIFINSATKWDYFFYFAGYFDHTCVLEFGGTNYDNEECQEYRTFESFVLDIIKEEDPEKIRLMTFHIFDAITDNFINYYDNLTPEQQEPFRKHSSNIELIKDTKLRYQEIVDEKYPDIKFTHLLEQDAEVFNVIGITFVDSFNTYINNIPEDIENYLTPSFFIAGYLHTNYLVIIIITILVIYDSFYRDFKSGVTKTILSAPTRRFRYIIMKTISSTLGIIVIVILPIILGYIYLWITFGIDQPAYSIQVSNTTFNSFKPNLKYARYLNDFYTADGYSRYSAFCTINPLGKYPVDAEGWIVDTTLANCNDWSFRFHTLVPISVSSIVGYMCIYTLLLIVFLATLNTLFSLLFDSPIINLSILGTLIGGSLLINKLLIGNPLLNYLPTTFFNPGDLIYGALPYTYLNGVVTLSVWIILLSIANYIVTKKKDFLD